MAGVNSYSLEHPATLDFLGLAFNPYRIFDTSGTDRNFTPQYSLDLRGRPDLVRDLAKKSMDSETAPFRRGRLFNLVLGRQADLAGTASKLAFCCYIEPGTNALHYLHNKTTCERVL